LTEAVALKKARIRLPVIMNNKANLEAYFIFRVISITRYNPKDYGD